MTRYQIIYWRDIPVQVRGKNGRVRLTRPLSPRFQKTVYRAAFRARAISGFDYINEWQPRSWREQDGDVHDVVNRVADELETAYSDERLDRLARNKGFEWDDN